MEDQTKDTFASIPKRYEDTKPALNQVYTHTNILGLGEKIRQKVENLNTHDKEKALVGHEKVVWDRAMAYKDECVAKALSEAKILEEKNLQRVGKNHAKNLKEELNKLKESLNHEFTERLYEERKFGQTSKINALEQLRKEMEEIKDEAIVLTISEQKNIARNAAEQREEKYQAQTNQLLMKFNTEKVVEISQLKIQLNDEKDENVKQAQLHEQGIAADNISQIEKSYELQLNALQNNIQDLHEMHKNILLELENMTKQKDFYFEKYRTLHDHFTKFIENSRSDFSKGQAEFLLPPISDTAEM